MPERFTIDHAFVKATREARGFTQRSLAKALGVSFQLVGQWERGEGKPGRDNLLALAHVLQVRVDQIAPMYETERVAGPAQELARIPDAPDVPSEGRRDVPIYNYGEGAQEADYFPSEEQVGWAPRPRGIIDRQGIFAIYIRGSSMEPRYYAGEAVYVDPHRPPKAGEDVLVELHPEPGDPSTKGYIKQLVRETADHVVCRQFNPPRDLEFSRAKLLRMRRIIPWNELLGI